MKSVLSFLLLILMSACSLSLEKTGEPYSNGQISSRYTVTSDGLKNGSYTTFHENGRKRSEGIYENNRQTGFWTTWHDNGNKSSEGSFNNGMQTGEWKFYYKNGTLQQINHFENDKPEGEFTDYYDTGTKKRTGFCVHGLLNGRSVEYYPNGSVSSELMYKDQNPNGPFVEYFPDGKLRAKGTWKDTVLVGDYFVFDSLDNSNYRKYFFYENAVSSDTGLVFKNNKPVQYRIYDKEGNSIYVDIK